MLKIPEDVLSRFGDFLSKKNIPITSRNDYKKWLRYYLDYCHKYRFYFLDSGSIPHFLKKLKEKNQTGTQQKQAHEAIRFLYELAGQQAEIKNVLEKITHPDQGVKNKGFNLKPAIHDSGPNADAYNRKKAINKGQTNQNWQKIYDGLNNEIKVRHYSPKTLKSYRIWIRKFQNHTKSKNPDTLASSDVKDFLTFLAVKQNVSASSQNQAFNSLLFLFRHVLHKDFGKIDGVVRAKRKRYIPVVLSREEIEQIINNLRYPYNLMVKLIYGCGLRLSECLNLRLGCLNFDTGILTVHDGKGKKDRTVPLPEKLYPELQSHLQKVKNLHKKDLEEDYNGAFMMNRLEKKYKGAGKELVWQWLFPAKSLTYVPESDEFRRYHHHETHVQRAIKKAVSKAHLTKRASAHTFRHSFASHLLQANYDIRTIQELLGHSDVRTTMIYTHTIKSQTLKEAKSPLDF
ncbi:integron integrase [Thermodesulfobacteriota bacterium]